MYGTKENGYADATQNAIEFLICYRLAQNKTRYALTKGKHTNAIQWELHGKLPSPPSLENLHAMYFADDTVAAKRFDDLLVQNRKASVHHMWKTQNYQSFGLRLSDLPEAAVHQELHHYMQGSQTTFIQARGTYIYALRRVLNYSQTELAEYLGLSKDTTHSIELYTKHTPHRDKGVIDSHVAKLEEAVKAMEETKAIPYDQRLGPYFSEHRWKNLPIIVDSRPSTQVDQLKQRSTETVAIGK